MSSPPASAGGPSTARRARVTASSSAARARRARIERQVIRPALFVLASLPAIILGIAALSDRLGANPIEQLTHESGEWTLRLLLVTLAMTPLRRLSGWTFPIRIRRMLGLFTCFYATLHFSIYLVLDQFFAWGAIVDDIIERPYITVGFLALCLLFTLAATSPHAMVRRLGSRRWKKLHRSVYLAAGLGVLHFLWLVKADYLEPVIYTAVLGVLLALRLPWPLRAKKR